MKRSAGSGATGCVRAAAFTLAEVLLVIGMFVLIVAAAGLWVQRSMFAAEYRSPQEVFLAASAQARILAMQQGKPVLLAFDEDAQGFRLSVIDADSPGGKAVSVGDLPWQEQSGSTGFWRFARSVTGAQQSGSSGSGAALGTDANAIADGTAAAGQSRLAAADKRFFALSPEGRLRVTFNLLYGEENAAIPQALEGIRYHPSGASTPVQVRMEESASGFRLTLLPDHLSSGLRMDGRSDAPANGNTTGGWR